MKGPAILLLLAACSVQTASAEVYRCQQDGKLTYTDQPCHPGAEPASLPPLNRSQADRSAPSLAKQYDADAERQSDSQAKADRDWLKTHGDDKTQDDAIRKALIENRIVKGMTPDQVRRVLNNPTSIEDQGGPKERWTYQNGRERRTIAFKNGVVSSDTLRSPRK